MSLDHSAYFLQLCGLFLEETKFEERLETYVQICVKRRQGPWAMELS